MWLFNRILYNRILYKRKNAQDWYSSQGYCLGSSSRLITFLFADNLSRVFLFASRVFLFANNLSLFADNLSPNTFLFANNLSRKIPWRASPSDLVCKPLHLMRLKIF